MTTLPPTDPKESTRDHGPQPLVDLMRTHELEPRHLVAASTEQLNFKMVSRAMKGRRLTRNTMDKVLAALNTASGKTYAAADAFSYAKGA